jgi:Bacteriophage Sf6, terminase small subunit-like
MAGQPTKFSPELQERICQLIRVGTTIDIAAEATGISRASFFNYQRQHPRFREAVEQARAEAEAILVGRVHKAAQAGSWRAACWLLERQWPERWAALADRSRVSDELDRELAQMLTPD